MDKLNINEVRSSEIITDFSSFKIESDYEPTILSDLSLLLDTQSKFVLNSSNIRETISLEGVQIELPEFNLFDKYSSLIEQNLNLTAFEDRWKYKPNYMSIDIYGNPYLEHLLMYVNGAFSKRDFTITESDFILVKFPNLEIIDILVQYQQKLLNSNKNKKNTRLYNIDMLYSI